MDAICLKCYFALNDVSGNSDLYTITKCGHVYHGECLKNQKYFDTCHKCHTDYDLRQCHKTYVYPEQTSPPTGNEDTKYYEWFYCDIKTECNDEFQNFALKLGTDEKNDDIYAARVFSFGVIVPAYYIPAKKIAIASMGGEAHAFTENIDVLDISADSETYYKWKKPRQSGKMPRNAFNIAEISENALFLNTTGKNDREEKLYIICAEYEGKMRYGKLSSKENKAYITYGQKEIKIDDYSFKVLVREP